MTPNPHSTLIRSPLPSIQPDAVLVALRQWQKDGPGDSPFASLVLFQSRQRACNGSIRHITNGILREAVDRLAIENAEFAQILRSRFLDGQKVLETCHQLNIAESTLHNRQKNAADQLTEIINDMETEARRERCDALLQPLSLQPESNQIGIDRHLNELVPTLINADAPWIVSIEGIGGIGKTTLADALMRIVIHQDLSWEQIAWVTARQNELTMGGSIGVISGGSIDGPALSTEALVEQLYEQLLPELPRPASFSTKQALGALEQHLRAHKCLVVIDNLETVADVESLLPTLREFANPSKFILTSRKSFYAAREIFHFQVPELDVTQALVLVRGEAEASNLPHVAAASDHELRPIYTTVGGNPLALRLVTGQLHVHGLQEILDDLIEARTETAENLYIFVYRRAWTHLSELARRTLIAMILVTDYGDAIDELIETCNLSRSELREALKQLVALNLVDSRGGLNDRRYTIHNLTRSFLHKQVLAW